jgi:hypothetical protein
MGEPFLVDAGGVCAGPGEGLGEVAVTERTVFRIPAPRPRGRRDARGAALSRGGQRERQVVREPRARTRNGAM